MKRLIVFLLVLTGFAANSFAQNLRLSPVVIPTQGKQTKVGNFALSWTVGESLNRTTRNGNLTLSQGFQQPIVSLLSVASTVVHKSYRHYGGIYLNTTGGIPPYQYEWSDVAVVDYQSLFDSLEQKASALGITVNLDSANLQLTQTSFSRRLGIDTGKYHVTIRDSRGYSYAKTYRVGNISKFLITSSTLENDSGIIIKSGSSGWNNNACVSMMSAAENNDAQFEFQLNDGGNFDFGFRNLSESLLGDSLFDATNYTYGADEYYLLTVRDGFLNYAASNSATLMHIIDVAANDKISLAIDGNEVIVRKNGKKIIVKNRSSDTDRFLYTVARIYTHDSSFKIIENIVY